MSYSNYEKAMELAPQCKFYTTAGGKNEEEIKKAEELLGVKFSAQLTDLYKKYGYLSFFGTEIFGIEPFDTSGELEGNSVAYALNDRFEYGLPNEWIPIFNCGDGSMVYLDYSTLNGDNEPRVILGAYNGLEYTVVDTLSEDFGDFMLELVTESLG